MITGQSDEVVIQLRYRQKISNGLTPDHYDYSTKTNNRILRIYEEIFGNSLNMAL
jgi:hypothetical protein